jgi:hypothetical protein
MWIVASLAVLLTVRANRFDVAAIFVVTAHAIPRRDGRVGSIAMTLRASGRSIGRCRIFVM